MNIIHLHLLLLSINFIFNDGTASTDPDETTPLLEEEEFYDLIANASATDDSVLNIVCWEVPDSHAELVYYLTQIKLEQQSWGFKTVAKPVYKTKNFYRIDPTTEDTVSFSTGVTLIASEQSGIQYAKSEQKIYCDSPNNTVTYEYGRLDFLLQVSFEGGVEPVNDGYFSKVITSLNNEYFCDSKSICSAELSNYQKLLDTPKTYDDNLCTALGDSTIEVHVLNKNRNKVFECRVIETTEEIAWFNDRKNELKDFVIQEQNQYLTSTSIEKIEASG